MAKFLAWPADAFDIGTADVVAMYERGYSGAIAPKPDDTAALVDGMQYATAEDAAHAEGWAESGAGKLCIPFVAAMQYFPGCWPGPGQTTGDCVSWGTRNACLTLIGAEIAYGKPDEQTGLIEGPVEISEEGIRNGVFATEPIYGDRGHSGQGASCDRLARHVTEWGGLMPRQNYPDLNIDFTRYNSSIGARWGGRGTPENVKAEAKKHPVRQATSVRSMESCRDSLWQGFGVNTCGGEGYSSRRDENGVSKRQGSWAHSIAEIAFDDRDIIKAIYNEPLVCELNSWGRNWNSGPRDIYQSAALVPPHLKELWIRCGIVNPSTGNIMIPEGSFWTPWSHARNRSRIAFAGANGWKRKDQPPDYVVI